MNATKDLFRRHLDDLRGGRFDQFEYVGHIDDEQRKTFHVALQKLLDMEIRFPCPTISITVRNARKTPTLQQTRRTDNLSEGRR